MATAWRKSLLESIIFPAINLRSSVVCSGTTALFLCVAGFRKALVSKDLSTMLRDYSPFLVSLYPCMWQNPHALRPESGKVGVRNELLRGFTGAGVGCNSIWSGNGFRKAFPGKHRTTSFAVTVNSATTLMTSHTTPYIVSEH
jgi:hypothetical protein